MQIHSFLHKTKIIEIHEIGERYSSISKFMKLNKLSIKNLRYLNAYKRG